MGEVSGGDMGNQSQWIQESEEGSGSGTWTLVLDAAHAVIDASLRAGGVPTAQQLDLIRAVPIASFRDRPHSERRAVMAGQIMALSRTGMHEEAFELAEAAAIVRPSRLDFDLSVEEIMAFQSAISEAFLGAGYQSRALEFAMRMVNYGESGGAHPRWQHRALGQLASAHALNGTFADAKRTLKQQRALVTAQGWDTNESDYLGSMAEAVLAFMSLDAKASASVAKRLRARVASDPTSRSLVDLLDAVALMLNGDPYGASALAVRVAQGTSQPMGPRLIQDFGVMLQAFILLQEHEPMRVLGLLRGMQPSEHHLICPAVARAGAYLQMGEYQNALSETRDCVKRRTKHNIWFLPYALLCRAIANMRLGHEATALRDAGAALAHVRQSPDLSAIFAQFNADDLTALFDLVDKRIPKSVANTAPFRKALERAGGTNNRVLEIPKLSKRESIVAHELRKRAGFAEIAKELHVSSGTVRSQAGAIYRKLGVDNREEAVHRLESLGFYEL
ncbi:LuxR C-terminal-related transcriptional regulator [Leucobacter sp. NPDC058333]|uniref:helix-turn-helix transcriptional regulator n=1 Tax=Leucobacter sp. NPDC058333 TaxID=3346450 RepID=UPI00366762EE